MNLFLSILFLSMCAAMVYGQRDHHLLKASELVKAVPSPNSLPKADNRRLRGQLAKLQVNDLLKEAEALELSAEKDFKLYGITFKDDKETTEIVKDKDGNEYVFVCRNQSGCVLADMKGNTMAMFYPGFENVGTLDFDNAEYVGKATLEDDGTEFDTYLVKDDRGHQYYVLMNEKYGLLLVDMEGNLLMHYLPAFFEKNW